MRLRALILFAPGTNCEKETHFSLSCSGFYSRILSLSEVLQQPTSILKYDLFVIPGGFSFGDDIKAGKVLALYIKTRLFEVLQKFYSEGKMILGICNGFQVLLRAGILPYFSGEQVASLELNQHGKFEDRWIFLKKEGKNPWSEYLDYVIPVPIAHAEGRFVTEPSILERIEKECLVAFRYCNKEGEVINSYPVNPNASLNNIAGITDPEGRIIGLMPHPERAFLAQQYPDFHFWNSEKSDKNPTTGEKFFKGIKDFLLSSK